MRSTLLHLVLPLGLLACTSSSGEIKGDLDETSIPGGGETGTEDPDEETGGLSTDSALDSGAPEDSAETGDSATEDTGEPDDEPEDPPPGHVCWTLYEDVYVDRYWAGHVDPATGRVTPVVELSADDDSLFTGLSSLGREDDRLYACGTVRNTLVTISLLDGSVTGSDVSCWSAARWRGESAFAGGLVLLTQWSNSVELYPELNAALDDGAGDLLLGDDTVDASRITVGDDLLFAAGSSSDTIEVVDLATGEILPSIVTEDRDDWVWGMAILENALLVMDYDVLSSFNRYTGDLLGAVELEAGPDSYNFFGLLCESEEELEEY